MQYELWILIAATALGLVHLSMESFSFKMQVGNSYTVGPRDTTIAREGLAGRCYRAYRNFQETYPIFAVLVLVVYSTDSTGQLSQWGTTLYIAFNAHNTVNCISQFTFVS